MPLKYSTVLSVCTLHITFLSLHALAKHIPFYVCYLELKSIFLHVFSCLELCTLLFYCIESLLG